MVSSSSLQSAPVFDQIGAALQKDNGQLVKKLNAIYCFKVNAPSGGASAWVVDLKNGAGSVTFLEDAAKAKADCTLTMTDEDLLKLMKGQLNPQQAFMQGKLKIAGNMGLAMKLKDLLGTIEKSKL